jgi:hypothetical protein
MIVAALVAVLAQSDGSTLSAADLAEYLRALAPSDRAAEPVAFLDLWEHPEVHRGRRVRVSGRFARQFQQPASGRFPALTELWLSTPAGNLFCVVFPSGEGEVRPTGATLRFEGTFLRRIRYAGGDVARLAPLIVGAGPPRVVEEREAEAPTTWPYWVGAGLIAAAVGFGLALLHMRGMGAAGARRYRRPPALDESSTPGENA